MFLDAKEKVKRAMFPLISMLSKNSGRPGAEIIYKGTGFFINDKGLLISASHIFERGNKDVIYLYKGIPSPQGLNEHIKIEEIYRSEKEDLFIGKIQKETKFFLELKTDLIQVGTSICLGGYPEGREYWIETLISHIEPLETPYCFLGYFTNGIPLPIMSGGPAFDIGGNVIGMISGVLNSKFGVVLNSCAILQAILENRLSSTI